MRYLKSFSKFTNALLAAGVSLSTMDAGLAADGPTSQPVPTRQVSHQTDLQIGQPDTSDTADWWQPIVTTQFRDTQHSLPITLESVLVRALEHSSQVRVFSELPLIRETAITEASAAFDWHAFADTRWDDLSDPVGNTLTTGANGRFNDRKLSGSYGLRSRNREGGQFEISQEHGYQKNNSNFFLFNGQKIPQSSARLRLSYTHPLMRGSTREYNESLIVLAEIDTKIAHDEFRRQLQSHLLEVVRAYWGVYLERSALTQKLQSYDRAAEVVERLEKRRNVDAVESQVVSAKAALELRSSELLRAKGGVRNAEGRLRALVNDTDLGTDIELIPMDYPSSREIPVSLDHSLATAIQMRPEVNQALKQIQASAVRTKMSKHELMPVLNLITEGYIAGLRGNEQLSGAWADQFGGRPGYSIGLQYEMALCNRAAKARLTRRQLELRQLNSQYQTTLATLRHEVEVAVREVTIGHKDMVAKRSAMQASDRRLKYLEKRWQHLPGEDLSASLALESLLSAQEQLAASEQSYLSAKVTYNLAISNLKRAKGTLLQDEAVQIGRTCDNGLPTLRTGKQDLGVVRGTPTQSSVMVTPVEQPMSGYESAPIESAPIGPEYPVMDEQIVSPFEPLVPATTPDEIVIE